MSQFTAQSTVAEIVTARPSTAALFDQLEIDFCCGGEVALEEAAGRRGLDPQTLLATLNALDAVQGDSAGAHDVAELSSDDLVEHIIKDHHARARKQIPIINDLLATVVRVHGEDDPNFEPMRARFAELGVVMLAHMDEEEADLFPLCRELESGEGARVNPALIDQLVHEHEEVGAALAELRRLSGGYDQTSALCNTHRFLLQSLMEFDEDTRVHVHEENNVLFLRARTALEAASAR